MPYKKLKAALVILLLLQTFTANSEVLHIAETGFIIENKIQTKESIKNTWLAFTQNIGKWWPADHTWWGKSENLSIDTKAGGCFCETDGKKSAEHMRISFVEPYKLLRMTGGLGPLQGMGMYGALAWTFTETKEGTTVTMTYKVNGINPQGFEKLAPIVDHVQGLQLGGLSTYLSTKTH